MAVRVALNTVTTLPLKPLFTVVSDLHVEAVWHWQSREPNVDGMATSPIGSTCTSVCLPGGLMVGEPRPTRLNLADQGQFAGVTALSVRHMIESFRP